MERFVVQVTCGQAVIGLVSQTQQVVMNSVRAGCRRFAYYFATSIFPTLCSLLCSCVMFASRFVCVILVGSAAACAV